MSDRCRFFFQNLCLSAGVTASSAQAGAPAGALLEKLRKRAWWSDPDASEEEAWATEGGEAVETEGGEAALLEPVVAYLDWDLGQVASWRHVGLVDHNLSTSAVINIAAGSASGLGDIYQQTFRAWEPIVTLGQRRLNWPTLGGYVPQAEAQSFLGGTHRVLEMAQQVDARYLRWIFSDPDNPDGFIKLGVPFCGHGWQPRGGPVNSFKPKWDSLSKHSYSEGGQLHTDKGRKKRLLPLVFDADPLDLDWGWRWLRALVGSEEGFIFQWTEDNRPGREFWTGGYFRLKEFAEDERPGGWARINLTLEELL